MAELQINITKIKDNIKYLSNYLNKANIKWSLVTKVFSGDCFFLEKLLTKDVVSGLHSVGDSRLTSLKNIKKVNPDLRTIYIKPPAPTYVEEVVQYADVSLNTSSETIKALNNAAKKYNKTHQVIIMIELGELREGVLRENVMGFYKDIFNLSNIEVVGIGTNLGCMYGVEPTFDKLMQLKLYTELLELKFNCKLDLISGGSSITLPLISTNSLPEGINHFRIGESAFFGTSPYDNKQFEKLYVDAFVFKANILELEEKAKQPDGVINNASVGHTSEVSNNIDMNDTTLKAILDFGILDVNTEDIEPTDENIKFIGTTSDMTVYEITQEKSKYKVGKSIYFKPNYMAVARLMNSKFITTSFIE